MGSLRLFRTFFQAFFEIRDDERATSEGAVGRDSGRKSLCSAPLKYSPVGHTHKLAIEISYKSNRSKSNQPSWTLN